MHRVPKLQALCTLLCRAAVQSGSAVLGRGSAMLPTACPVLPRLVLVHVQSLWPVAMWCKRKARRKDEYHASRCLIAGRIDGLLCQQQVPHP
jgi:hypothetical protein